MLAKCQQQEKVREGSISALSVRYKCSISAFNKNFREASISARTRNIRMTSRNGVEIAEVRSKTGAKTK